MADVTNYIDRLVAELCPDGVEYRPLGEIADIGTGKSDKKDAQESGQYPFYVRSKTILRSSKYLYDETAIVIPGEGGVGEIFHFVSGKYDLHQRAYRVSFTVDEMNPKFGYYYISSFFKEYINRHAVEATVKSIRKPMLVKFEVPVPPLEIQEAIVEILDKFTNLEAELEAELEARTLQYEYYRDSLFEALDCPRVPLGELGKFYGGLKGKTKNDFGSSGARYISYKNVYENISADFTWPDFVQVKEGENQLSLMKGDILLTGSSENMEESGLSSVVTKEPEEKAYLNSFSICYRLNDPSILNPEFSKYLFRSRLARKQIIRTAQGVTRFNVSKKKLANVSIPIPSLEEQQRIVDILDRFDALTTSLSEGLPAELAARRSQYEYYRDQLLTFPRKGENQ